MGPFRRLPEAPDAARTRAPATARQPRGEAPVSCPQLPPCYVAQLRVHSLRANCGEPPGPGSIMRISPALFHFCPFAALWGPNQNVLFLQLLKLEIEVLFDSNSFDRPELQKSFSCVKLNNVYRNDPNPSSTTRDLADVGQKMTIFSEFRPGPGF